MARSDRRRAPALLHHGLVGTILGYPLAIAGSGLLHALMRAAGAGATLHQLTMWVVYPLWLVVLSLAFLAPSRRACWTGLLLANALAALACWWVLGPRWAAP